MARDDMRVIRGTVVCSEVKICKERAVVTKVIWVKRRMHCFLCYTRLARQSTN
jgi:hypothetical protein